MGLDVLSGQGILPGLGFVNPSPAPAAGRGLIVQLGKVTSLNLNVVAATTIFTTPASGITRCVVTEIVADNPSGTPTTNAVSFGAAATPTDYLAATVLAGTFVAGKGIELYPAANTAFAVYGTSISFVANVTVGGAAITADFTVMGYYE